MTMVRAFSLNIYGTRLDTVDTLRDEQIAPDAGCSNPFAAEAAGTGGGTWRASFVTGQRTTPATRSRRFRVALRRKRFRLVF